MATVDRIEPAYPAWTPSSAGLVTTPDENYVGRHRGLGFRGTHRVISMVRVFYTGRHRS